MEATISHEINQSIEVSELKTPLRHSDIDMDSLSEWELARMTSKTWSMEQD